MIFTSISKEVLMFGKGKQLGKDYFEIMEGVKIFFYDSDSIKQEVGKYGRMEFSEIVEPHKNMENNRPFKFIWSVIILHSFHKFFCYYYVTQSIHYVVSAVKPAR